MVSTGSLGNYHITITTCLVLVLLATRQIVAGEPEAEVVPPEGFVALFNGKDFTGLGPYKGSSDWRKHWRVEPSSTQAGRPEGHRRAKWQNRVPGL